METPHNEFLVGAVGDQVQILMPPRGPISKDRAIALAAWIVALADDGEDSKFGATIEAVQNS